MKYLLIMLLISFNVCAQFPGPGVIPSWERVCTYSDTSGLTAGTADLIMYGSWDVRNDGTHDGTVTSDRVYTDYLEATFFSPNAISVQSLTANTVTVTGDITGGSLNITGSGTINDISATSITSDFAWFDYLYSALGINANAITADHTIIGYETVMGGINTNALTSNKVIVGSDGISTTGSVSSTKSITTGAFFYGDITKTTGYHATSEVFIEGTQGVQVSGNTLEFRNAGVSRVGDIIFIDCPQGGGGGAALTNDIIGIDKYLKLSEVDRTTVPTPGTGEVNIFNDSISHEPAIKDWLGRVYGFVLQSLEDIPFLFNSATYTDYTINGTKGANWDASSTAIYNVDDLANPSGSPYALTIQTGVPRLVDCSGFTPSSFVVDYGSYDLGGCKFGIVGNGGVIYSCSTYELSINATQSSSSDFLDWTVYGSSGYFDTLDANSVKVNASYSDWVYTKVTPQNSVDMRFEITLDGSTDYVVGMTSNPTSTPRNYLNPGIFRRTDNNMAWSVNGITGGEGVGYGNLVASPASSKYYVRILVEYTSTTTANIYFWANTSYSGTIDTADVTKTGVSILASWYAIAGSESGSNGSPLIENYYINKMAVDTTNGIWRSDLNILNSVMTESQVNLRINTIKTNSSITLIGPYVSMTSGTTGEIEAINIGM